MTVTRKRFFARALAASAAALFVPKQAARADGNTAPEIEGTWRFDNVPAPGGTLVSLQTFARGGVFLESAVLIGSTAITRTTSQGVWEKIGPQHYLKTFEFFNERKSGEIVTVVRVRVREEVHVNGDVMTIGNVKLTRHNLDGTDNSEAPCGVSNAVGIRLGAVLPSCP